MLITLYALTIRRMCGIVAALVLKEWEEFAPLFPFF